MDSLKDLIWTDESNDVMTPMGDNWQTPAMDCSETMTICISYPGLVNFLGCR